MSSMAKRSFRGTGRTAVASGILLAAGVLAGTSAGSAGATAGPAAPQLVRLRVGYDCQFPSAEQPISVVIATAFPAAAAAGQPIRPTGVRITAVLPQPAVTYLRTSGAATVTASEALTVVESYAGRSVPAGWQAAAPAAALPATGSMQLAAAGSAPAATAASRGAVTFAVGRLRHLRSAAHGCRCRREPGRRAGDVHPGPRGEHPACFRPGERGAVRRPARRAAGPHPG